MKNFEICSVGENLQETLELINNYNNGVDKHIGVMNHQFEFIAASQEDYLCSEFAEYLYRNKEAACYFSLYASEEEIINLDHATELLKSYPNGYIPLVVQARSRCSPDYRKFVDDKFEEYAFQVDVKRLYGYLPNSQKSNNSLIKKLVNQSLVYEKYVDDELLKECVKDTPHLLSTKTSEVRGKVGFMRELVRINADCAKYALAPITTKAGVKTTHTDEERQRKVYEWLMATGERKEMKKPGVLVAVKPTAAAPKKVHKI